MDGMEIFENSISRISLRILYDSMDRGKIDSPEKSIYSFQGFPCAEFV